MAERLSDEVLAELERLERAATWAPWSVDGCKIPMSETQREIERFYKDVAMRVLREIEKLTMAGPVSNHYSPEPSCPGPQSDEAEPNNINDIE